MTLDIQLLADRIAIEERLLLYAHYLDSGQFERVASEIFTLDANVDFGGANVKGRDAIHAQVMGYKDALQGCSHNISNIIIAVDGDEARTSSRVMAWHWLNQPDADPYGQTDLLAVGGYEDRLRRVAGVWRIHERRGLNFGTGVGVGIVPDPMKPIFQGMWGRRPQWPE
ncbi:nuclear transport factor 2 family protein [Sphingobium sp. TCM1]|uniref:nuclear transport factor 2 family protein n=1 Tax=Sphingobium sp. TCM1 TaxID=453246 RepID=UPI0007F427EC|nr:nuclear transport factor 2 family protein [Sphingobium sp. TCM1]OAN56254.1 hypothetical protein A7Q26_02300 [Sphingobium sp. TCM1]